MEINRVKASKSNNPKDRIGQSKVSITTIPGVALLYEARAMEDGARKYGRQNWREHSVLASIYIDAMLRHIYSWFEGEEEAPDSRIHHLGHARACIGILLDAQSMGNLIDDRPRGGKFVEVLNNLNQKKLNEVISKQKEK